MEQKDILISFAALWVNPADPIASSPKRVENIPTAGLSCMLSW
ncbi:unnamed protein product [marine sediment metagenome]|uniref:Uncharacterized protein n=1 Tax=marine sediment metagenome TaxID=412755 RepID=X1APM7_9ZZZZ